MLPRSDAVLEQMRAYDAAGLPYGAPLFEGEWHLRDLRDNRSMDLGCHWFAEFATWDHARDQTSLAFVAHDLGGFVRQADYWGYAGHSNKYTHVARNVTPRAHSKTSDIPNSEHKETVVMAYVRRRAGDDAAAPRRRHQAHHTTVAVAALVLLYAAVAAAKLARASPGGTHRDGPPRRRRGPGKARSREY